MSDIKSELEAEKSKRVNAMFSKFVRIGHPELVDELKDIFTIDDTITLFSQPTIRTRNPKSARAQAINDTPAPDGFVLSDEVRLAIMKITADRFRASTVYDILQHKWPTYITPDKKPRIGATLSNLVTGKELTVEKDSQRKTWYRVLSLRDVTPSDAAYISEVFSETVMN